jgi:hypothetical protein
MSTITIPVACRLVQIPMRGPKVEKPQVSTSSAVALEDGTVSGGVDTKLIRPNPYRVTRDSEYQKIGHAATLRRANTDKLFRKRYLLFDLAPSADLQPAAHPAQAIGLLRGPLLGTDLTRECSGGNRPKYSLASQLQHLGINDPSGVCILWPAVSLLVYLGLVAIRLCG